MRGGAFLVHRQLLGAVLATCLLLAVSSACGGHLEARQDLPTVRVDISADGTPRQTGRAKVRVDVVAYQGGQVTVVAGPGGARAARFPVFTQAALYPRAAIAITNRSVRDQLSPGKHDLTWGADVNLDRRSEAPAGDDNGNNILQRGLSGEPAQYKVELDGDRFACKVTGDEGIVQVRAHALAVPGRWYHVSCSRHDDSLTVTARDLDDRDAPIITRTATGPIGAIVMDESTEPLSIGCKMAPNGELIRQASDQFNGAIARAFVDIGS